MQFFSRIVFACLIVIVGFFLDGCVSESQMTIQLPADYQHSESTLTEKVNVDVYFDATVSMKGYTSLAAGNVYRTLPDLLGAIGSSMGEVKFYSFGENVAELPGRKYREFSSPTPYIELITAVHNVIDKSDRSHLSVIVTDLFESEADWSNISKKISDKFFANHMAVGIIGVRNSFSGEIFDVGLNAAKFQYDSYDYPYRFRPFYLLVMGQESAVKNFMDKFKDRQTLPNDTGYLLLSENLSEATSDFSKMTLQTLENFFVNDKINLADKSVREFGIDKFNVPASFTVEFTYNPPLGACPLDISELKPDVKIFALNDSEWELLPDTNAEITLTPVEEQENTYTIQCKILPEETLKDGALNFVHVSLAPSEKGFMTSEWIRNWNMPNIDVDPANFDGSKTINLIRVIDSLKDSVFSTAHPSLVNLNFVVDCR